jgi:hypothetical protein
MNRAARLARGITARCDVGPQLVNKLNAQLTSRFSGGTFYKGVN